MAVALTIFSLYKTLGPLRDSNEYILIRTTKPGYPNYNANLERLAEKIETQKRDKILNAVAQNDIAQLAMVGEFQGIPVGGEALRSLVGLDGFPLVYAQPNYGYPWIIIGSYETIEEFYTELTDDDELFMETVPNSAQKITAKLITENAYDLSGIKYFDIEDLAKLER
jgi:hypothetical protein